MENVIAAPAACIKNVPAVVVEIVYDSFGMMPPRVFTIVKVTKGWRCDIKHGVTTNPWGKK